MCFTNQGLVSRCVHTLRKNNVKHLSVFGWPSYVIILET